MKIKFYIVCLALFGLAANVLADYYELTQPSVAFAAGFPDAARTNIMAALRRPDCKFISGSVLNSFTSLKYGGNTLALNLFLESFAKCPGVTIAVRFSSDSSVEDCDWLVGHMAEKPGEFAVQINLKSTHIKLEELVIPEAKGPRLPEKK
jgi:hypothetical protein